MLKFFVMFVNVILSVFPRSPFQSYVSWIAGIPYLAQLNWIIPVAEMLAVMQTWLFAVAIFYVWSAIARFIGLL